MRNRKLIIGIIGLLGLIGPLGNSRAQNGFNMPYSQFGIGSSEQPFNMPVATRMGGAVYTLGGNNFTNPFNPASYGWVETESFVFDMGLSIQTTTLREGSNRVFDADREMGLLYLDMFPRPSKRSGAWMTEFRGQYGRVRPQIQVVCNFSKPTADAPALLRFSEVETFMHEMGHAMHGMLSDVAYESLSGTNVKRDFVEMPSQVMENWCYEPEFLATFARHYRTGEPLPTEYVEKIRAAQNHIAGWLCLRQLNLGMTDIAFHTVAEGTAVGKAEEVEAAAMENLLPRVEGCCTSTNFSHIFGGGYASGYYGYKWAEVLDADIFSRFKADGIFNRDTAEAFRREILSRGGSVHPAVLFRNFMGRDPDNNALLKRMNLI